MPWDHPNSEPLRIQILRDIVSHGTPAGCVTATRDTPGYLRLLPPVKASAKAKRLR
jgi:hypothetical protein